MKRFTTNNPNPIKQLFRNFLQSIGVKKVYLLVCLFTILLPPAEALALNVRGLLYPYYESTVTFQSCQSVGSLTGGALKSGDSVYILGDSISNRAKSSYESAFTAAGVTATVDASDSRSILGVGTSGNRLSGVDAVNADASTIASTNVKAVVIALGTNGGNSAANISTLLQAITTARGSSPALKIYWVDTIAVGRTDNYETTTIKASNTAIYDQQFSDKFSVISWAKVVDPVSDPKNPTGSETDNNGDIDNSDGLGVHPTAVGVAALTTLVVNSLTSVKIGNTANVCCATASSSLVGTDNLQKAFNFFIQPQIGLTPEQSAGIVGNIISESGGDPTRLQGDYTNEHTSENVIQIGKISQGIGWGIVQWTPPSKLIINSFNGGIQYTTIDTLDYQLKFLWEQLTGTGIGGTTANEKAAGNALKTATTAAEAARIFGDKYERFLNHDKPAGEAQYQARIKHAEDVLALYGGQTPAPSSSGSTTNCGTTNGTNFATSFTFFQQGNSAWSGVAYGTSTVGVSGGAPTSLAMVFSNLTGTTINPGDVATYANSKNTYSSSGGGSVPTIPNDLAPNWGLKATKIAPDVAVINSTLQNGGLIITSGVGNEPFTTGGHYIVIRALTPTGKWLIADPNDTSGTSNTTEWDPNSIVVNMNNISTYAITK